MTARIGNRAVVDDGGGALNDDFAFAKGMDFEADAKFTTVGIRFDVERVERGRPCPRIDFRFNGWKLQAGKGHPFSPTNYDFAVTGHRRPLRNLIVIVTLLRVDCND